MQVDWSPLEQELRLWRSAQLNLPIWWRDDDAISQTSTLDRMTKLAERLEVAIHLAVIPKHADASLVAVCQDQPRLVPMVHGWAHQNHATEGHKKAEFGEMRQELDEDAQAGIKQMRTLFSDGFVEIFVPPWNRIEPKLMSKLATFGYKAVSTFTPRKTREAAAGLVEINTHLDPINWRDDGGLVSQDVLISGLVGLLQDRRLDRTDTAEPLGILTHHLVQNAETWAFTETCLARLLDGGATPVNLRTCMDRLP
jgi:hypothetical protein